MKLCNKCKVEKNESDFYKDQYQSDGLKTICIACDNEQSRLYYQKVKNKFTKKKKKIRYENYKRWLAKNKEKYLLLQKLYREKRKGVKDIDSVTNICQQNEEKHET